MPHPKRQGIPQPIPNPEPSLFDAELVAENAGDWDRSIYRSKILALAATGHPFVSDDVADGMPDLDHPNRLGAIMRAAAAEGLIEAVGYQPSTKPSRHGAIVRVWRGRRAA